MEIVDLKSYFSSTEINFKVTTEDILMWFQKCEEEVVKTVLRQYLKIEPTLDDAKKCNKLYRDGIVDKYEFSYDGIILGIIVHHYNNYNEANRIGVEFYPITSVTYSSSITLIPPGIL